MDACVVVAGLWNAHGGMDGKACNWQDFHPAHAQDDPIEMARLNDDQSDADFGQFFGQF